MFTSLTRLALVVSFLVTLSNARSIEKNILWFPKDGGDGFIPAILNSRALGFEILDGGDPKHISFLLYTSKNPNNYDEISEESTSSIINSHWDVNAPVKIFAHGFGSSADGGSGSAIKQGYIDNGYPQNVNLILVNWERLARAPFYDNAADNTEVVGEKVANLVNFLLNNKFTTLDKIHLGGHSLGAHAMGIAGSLFQKQNRGSIIRRITGLDPALPLFGFVRESKRIDASDAEMVDIIHTASGKAWDGELSFLEPIGTVDFYPNSGANQPGCSGPSELVGACSHSRCYEYFSESIQNDKFVAFKCDDNDWDPKKGKQFDSCSPSKGQVNMGEWTPNTARGVYYLITNSESPFALN